MKKNYQNSPTGAGTGRATPTKTGQDTELIGPSSRCVDDNVPEWALPESVVVAMADLAETAREGLLALAVGTGLQVMQAMMDDDVCALAGPKGRWDPDGSPPVTAATTVRSPWVAGGCRYGDPGFVPPTAAPSWPWPATSCSPRPRSWVAWPWSA